MVKNVVTPARTSVRKLVLFSLSLNIRSSRLSEDGLGVVMTYPLLSKLYAVSIPQYHDIF